MLQISKIIPGGEALTTDENGKKIFLWNALPGEEIEDYEITKKKSHFNRGIATIINNSSRYRIAPEDPCYLSTSPWQIMDYDYELQLKQDLVVELFREHQIDINTPKIITDNNTYHYRNKMEYSLYYDLEKSKILPAFHMRGSHRKIPITKSSIERPEIFARALEIIDELNAKGEEARKYQSLLLRCNQKGEVSGGLYENGKPHPVFPNLTDTIMGYKYSYSPNGFFQINLPVYELALKEIKKHISTDNVLDLYSGVGTIGLSVARDKHLTLVECDKFAYREMTKNIGDKDDLSASISKHCTGSDSQNYQQSRNEYVASGHGAVPTDCCNSDDREPSTFRNTTVKSSHILPVLAKSEDVTDYITPDQTVILDPPRAGCDTKLINKLLEIKPSKIIYLSCNPATQARDVKALLSEYHIDGIKTFNFFPRTPHIENLVVLSL